MKTSTKKGLKSLIFGYLLAKNRWNGGADKGRGHRNGVESLSPHKRHPCDFRTVLADMGKDVMKTKADGVLGRLKKVFDLVLLKKVIAVVFNAFRLNGVFLPHADPIN